MTDTKRDAFEAWAQGWWFADGGHSEDEICSYADARSVAFAAWQAASVLGGEVVAFQARVQPWMLECFGAEIAADTIERNHRFFEEAAELVQACGMTASEAHQLVDYTFGRPVGEPSQEVGGVMVTLAALCLANGLDMRAAGETELARISIPETVAKIRAKQSAKPRHSPLPSAPAQPAQSAEPVVPANVMAALDRMCTPLHESRLSGATAEADARSMKLIRDYVLGGSASAVARAEITNIVELFDALADGWEEGSAANKYLIAGDGGSFVCSNRYERPHPFYEQRPGDIPVIVKDSGYRMQGFVKFEAHSLYRGMFITKSADDGAWHTATLTADGFRFAQLGVFDVGRLHRDIESCPFFSPTACGIEGDIQLAAPAQSCGDAERADAAVTADAAWEAYLNEQKLILGMPGLMAKPSFIAGYRARTKGSK